MMKNGHEQDKLVMSYLLRKGFQIKGYLSYPDHSDITAQFKPAPPLTNPVRIFVEISRVIPSLQVIDGLYSQARSAECTATVLVMDDPSKLASDASALMSKYGIELWTSSVLQQELKGVDLSKANETLEAVSTARLIRALPELARQVIPMDIRNAINDSKRKAWEVFEDAVYATFKSCFGYKVKQYGKESLFESEPEGLVTTTPGTLQDRFAFIYDCKSAENKYVVDSKDESKYAEYINEKKGEANLLEHCELKYFLIIGPQFGGDMNLRRQNLMTKTQVITAFIRAPDLQKLAEWAYSIEDPDVKRLIDLRKMIKLSEPEIDPATIQSYIAEFDRENKPRY